MSGCGYSGCVTKRPCEACEVERYVVRRIELYGCDPAVYDAPEVIPARLREAGVTIVEVRSDTVNAMVFWRAVYGPAYPEAVMS